jgi:Cu(I)/Ag(I) efflux system membrane fusion protein
LYSPELLTQQSFIYLVSNDSENASIIKLQTKLALYGMTTNQINSLAAAKRTNPVITIYSPTNGIVQGTESMTLQQDPCKTVLPPAFNIERRRLY